MMRRAPSSRRNLQPTASPSPPWHARSAAQTASNLSVDLQRGLTADEAQARLARFGRNVLRPEEREPWWEEVLESLTEPLQLLLLAVGGAYFIFGEVADALTILAIIVIVAGIEVANELRAKRAIASLSSLTAPTAVALRDGKAESLSAEVLVPGDLVVLRSGDRAPADLRLLESNALRVDESALTGESTPVAKIADESVPDATELAERVTMVYASTLVTAGRGKGVVVATGRSTELGRIAGLSSKAKEPRTPLQRAMKQLSRWLVWVALGFSVLVPVAGVLVAKRSVKEMILTGLTLAFATIPEELPILITIVLGIGAYRLAQRRAIVRHLHAAETLGSVSVVATDKTGTLTQNRMRVVALVFGRDFSERCAPGDAQASNLGRRLLEIGVLANDAELTSASAALIGDPTETALLDAAAGAGIDPAVTRGSVTIVAHHPFDDERKRMSVVVESDGARFAAVKGAPESVLAACRWVRTDAGDVPLDDDARAALQARTGAPAAEGLRTLAAAERVVDANAPEPLTTEELERDLVLLGLFALEDPPRAEASNSVAILERAGVRVLMLTGDHPATARAIAERVGIDASRVLRGRELEGASDEELSRLVRSASVFARITPEDKLRIVRALHANGDAVAVTGDGVNDAPALREATIGVAMGKGGTDVAREAAGLILADDDFATVTEAVRMGRVLFANLSKAVRYYLAAKVALVSSSLVAVLLKLPVPFDPVQIIVMELFMDLGASVTFVAEPPEEDVMMRAPRDPRGPFMNRPMKLGILAGGLSLGGAVLVAYVTAWARGNSPGQAQTAAFVAWMLGHIVLAAHMRSEHQPLLRQNPLANRAFLVWAAAAFAFVGAALLVQPIRERLHISAFGASLWPIVIAAAIVLPSWWEPWKWWRRLKGAPNATPSV